MTLVTDYLDKTAARFPDKVAFANEKRAMTFGALRKEARKIAYSLVKRHIFRQPVAIYLEKSPECIAAFMGTAYSGNFYTPLDVEMPKSRLEKIMARLQPKIIITDNLHCKMAREFAGHVSVVIYENLQDAAIDDEMVNKVISKVTDADVLYVMFTSGSTGTPKGVIIPQRSVVDYIEWFVDKFDISVEDTLGNQAPLYFDLSIQDVYATLKSGCTTYLLEKEKFTFPIKLMNYLLEKNVNVIMWVPSALCLVANLKALQAKFLPKLRIVLFCGEVMPNKQLNQWRKAMPSTVFVNLYGPSETCDASAYYIVDRDFIDDEPLPIGYPCKNTDIFVIGDNNRLVSGSAIGELCIRGTSLAYGYYRDPENTVVAFVQNPLQIDYPELIYRTGDLVRYNEYGELMYVGRKDFQIKHLGHRIELVEIETAVSSICGVERCACVYDAKRSNIVLFYTGKVDAHDINKQLKNKVPEYMLPNRKEKLKNMPTNLNGKIDRLALKELLN